ncbi:uncharacterized protein YbaA (DUF1428 family) [Rubricella aquisinus]|uniref:Uncharacterized protein YbaA (DUF1428 family) n=1 Tax=Rubricella aquisinus TaxID=2028108 RepID=A0A840WNZ8_9RHOB|nr:DUF1428 domain-containing protein [Rubricella aquisinus]MBB5516779.1 uncharacterized protein YbaA (DUF1428 family) [Rubricella aquisinus]
MTYVQGFVAAVPQENKADFITHAKAAAEIFMELGALSVRENWEVDVPDGEHTSFPMAVKRAEGEAIVFSWITWPDQATAHACMEKMMSDPQMEARMGEMPFDGKRMIYGGFETVFEQD